MVKRLFWRRLFNLVQILVLCTLSACVAPPAPLPPQPNPLGTKGLTPPVVPPAPKLPILLPVKSFPTPEPSSERTAIVFLLDKSASVGEPARLGGLCEEGQPELRAQVPVFMHRLIQQAYADKAVENKPLVGLFTFNETLEKNMI